MSTGIISDDSDDDEEQRRKRPKGSHSPEPTTYQATTGLEAQFFKNAGVSRFMR